MLLKLIDTVVNVYLHFSGPLEVQSLSVHYLNISISKAWSVKFDQNGLSVEYTLSIKIIYLILAI
jgi:hypothetical protein